MKGIIKNKRSNHANQHEVLCKPSKKGKEETSKNEVTLQKSKMHKSFEAKDTSTSNAYCINSISRKDLGNTIK